MRLSKCSLSPHSPKDETESSSPQETFSSIPLLSSRFSSTASSQYYQDVSSLNRLSQYLRERICPGRPGAAATECAILAQRLNNANYIDINFDAISFGLIFNVFWSQAIDEAGTWSDTATKISKAERVEVGVLNNERATESEEISLGGFLTFIGDDRKPSKSLFDCEGPLLTCLQ